MARILKRPMFNRGGSSNQGIMDGLVDRTSYENGDIVGRARELTPEMAELLGEFTPKTRIPLGSIGADLMSGKGFKDTAIDNYRTYTTADDKRNAAVQGSAVKLGLSQAIAEAKPDKSSVLAAEKKAKYLLRNEGKELTPQNIISKTAEIIKSEMQGKTYSPAANFEAAKRMYIQTYGEGGKAHYHASFDQKVAPQVRASGQIPKGRIKMKDNGEYKTKNKSPGVYVDVDNGKVIEFDGNIAKEIPELSALLR